MPGTPYNLTNHIMDTINTVYIATGSNLGDKISNCNQAIIETGKLDETRVTAVSKFYRTAPMHFTDQDWFINAAFKIETKFTPEKLLEKLKEIEKIAGRKDHGPRYCPRLLDLDIIFYNDDILQTKQLVIPHPRMHERLFVLRPLCDICASFRHPILKTSIETLTNTLANSVDENEQSVFECD